MHTTTRDSTYSQRHLQLTQPRLVYLCIQTDSWKSCLIRVEKKRVLMLLTFSHLTIPLLFVAGTKMAHKDNWAVIFADCFKNAEGWAIYKKIAATELKAGTCGYFDPQGDWEPIADLTNKIELEKKGFTYVPGITVKDDPGDERWPLRKSDNVHRVDLTAAANVR